MPQNLDRLKDVFSFESCQVKNSEEDVFICSKMGAMTVSSLVKVDISTVAELFQCGSCPYNGLFVESNNPMSETNPQGNNIIYSNTWNTYDKNKTTFH